MSDFESIYQQYGKTVYFFLLSLTQNESLSEELTQETMCRAIMNIGAFCGGKQNVRMALPDRKELILRVAEKE